MNTTVFWGGYIALVAATIAGAWRYKHLDKPMKLVWLLLVIPMFSEVVAYISVANNNITLKGLVYNIYSIIEIILITSFFLKAIKPCHYRKLLIATMIVWPVLGILNVGFLQPIDGLNTNILMLESFAIITMSLYFIYWLILKNVTFNIFRYPHFWVAVIWLVLWSGTFFFWAFIKMLYGYLWAYLNLMITIHGMLVLLTYCGFLLIFLRYPKNLKHFENN